MKWLALIVFAVAVFFSFNANTVFGQLGQCAVPIGPLRPDLIVDGSLLRAMMQVREEAYSPDSCAVVEGCITGPGTHLVLRFMSSTPNIGQTDLFIGDPTQCIGDLFRFSECHQHLHFQEYADYRLWTVAGYQKWVANRDMTKPSNSGKNAKLLADARANGELVVGRKQGFCMIDVQPFHFGDVEPGPARFLSCNSFQGIKVGWSDQYHPQLDCQFIQVTGVREGDYVLEDHVNPEHLFPESNFTNNASAVKFHFRPKQGRSGPTIEILD